MARFLADMAYMSDLSFLAKGIARFNHNRKASERRQSVLHTDLMKSVPRRKDRLTDEEKQMIADIHTQLQAEKRVKSPKICPECGRNFALVQAPGLMLDACPICQGIWFDHRELMRLTHERTDVPSDYLQSRPSRYKCPVCGEQMEECVYLKPNNLLVDKCPHGHGVYLEKGELARVLKVS